MKFIVGKDTVREFDIELDTSEKPQFWAFADVSAFKGKKLIVSLVLPADSRLPDFGESDDVPAAEKVYQEKHRPLFHFTSRFGWLNDPNGLVYADGEWHLFYQHNPFGVNWGNMHWGHAVSKDLVRWEELGIGLYPKKYGDWAFSGSAVVDKGNTSGWGTKEKPPLVLAYTSTGRGECIAFSTDKGRTWKEHDKNPVVKHQGRDPKLVWYEKGNHWVMAVYDEFEKKQWIAFYTSPDLKTWTFASRIEGFFECPDLFPIALLAPVEKQQERWVLYAADGKYLTGDFDGKTFKPDSKEKKQLWYGKFYAAQTFDNATNRRVQIGWGQGITFPGMPFNQQMTVPVELSLWSEAGGAWLSASPVESLQELRDGKAVFEVKHTDPVAVPERRTIAENLDACDVEVWIDPKKSTGFTLDVRGTKLVYDSAKGSLTCKDVNVALGKLPSGVLSLRVLVDRGSIEVFAEGGRVAMSVAAIPDEKNRKLELIPNGGEVTIRSAAVYRMKSAWAK
jgi:fructan beta-fructosidase